MEKRYQKLRGRWSAKEKDWLFSFPRKPDGHLLSGFFSGYANMPELLKELEARGYDLTTLKFEIRLKDEEIAAIDKRNAEYYNKFGHV